MATRFTPEAKQALEGAVAVAGRLGAKRIDAEHLLLALAEGEESLVARGLATAGANPGSIEEALENEFQDALIHAGVGDEHRRPHRRSPHSAKRLPMGQSAKLALERALGAAKMSDGGDVSAGHLLVGIVAAEVGTVPRLLDQLGVSRSEIQAAASDDTD